MSRYFRRGTDVIKKILIANRGEIAVRIVRACAEMGIRSVAVYSEADRHALHVKRADEAYNLGEDPLAGYLNPRRLVNLAVETGCDALHRSEEHTSELQSRPHLVCRLLLEKKKHTRSTPVRPR